MNQSIEKTEIDTGCFSLVFLGCKSAVHILNSGMKPATNVGKDTYHVRVLRARIAIQKTVESE